MITRKSKIKYYVKLDYNEFMKVREMYIKHKYIVSAKDIREGTAITDNYCETITYNVCDLRYYIYFTTKQYELFKRLWYETKNKK